MIKVEKTEKTEKINHYKQIVKSLYLANIAVQNYNLTQKEKEKKRKRRWEKIWNCISKRRKWWKERCYNRKDNRKQLIK